MQYKQFIRSNSLQSIFVEPEGGWEALVKGDINQLQLKSDIDYASEFSIIFINDENYGNYIWTGGYVYNANSGGGAAGHIYNEELDSLAEGINEDIATLNTASGVRSHAEGVGTEASGEGSHAEGCGTSAYSNYSHAEGRDTIAYGEYSHAEGYNTTASGNYSQSIGKYTTASGEASHAEGESTTASGQASHTEGYNTTASGACSHAEGQGTTASGNYSQSIGKYTTASGEASHAEGDSTKALFDYSHAEGLSTKASGDSSHAEGESTTASGRSSHAEGASTEASGEYSHAEGESTTASGWASHAEGASTEASGEYSHAEGSSTTASGTNSHAENFYTNAEGNYSHASGQYTTAFGIASHAEGEGGQITLFRTSQRVNNSNTIYLSRSSSFDSDSDSARNFFAGSDFISDFAMSRSDSDGIPNIYDIEKGNKLNGWIGRSIYKANGDLIGIITNINTNSGMSITIDRNTTLESGESIYIKSGAFGENSHTEGYLSDATGVASHAEGERTQATGTNAHSEGYHTKAFGGNSHAEGCGTEALTFGSHAEGKQTHVEGEYSHSEGYDTKASGTYAHGEGKSSSAQGDWSHAEGEDSQASGIGAHAEGTHCNAQGAYSHAEGFNTTTDGNFEPRNTSDKETWQVAAHAEGKDTEAKQTAAHSEGINTKADGDAAHSEGVDSKSLSRGAHAEGINTFVNEWSEGSHTEGYETQIHDSTYSHTEGWKTFVQSKSEYVNRNVKVKLKSYNSNTHRITLELVDGEMYSLSRTFSERKNSRVDLKSINDHYRIKIHNFIVNDNDEQILEIEPRYNNNWRPGENENKSFIYDNIVEDALNNYPDDIYQVRRVEYEGYGAHAEGGETFVEGTYAHAEGEHTRALNRGAHAEGFKTEANEKYSHAEGWYTEATHKAEHAQGRCNKSNDVHINTAVEYVDLGLPSGNLWAKYNIGATTETEWGNEYAWGEIETKENYSWDNYKYARPVEQTDLPLLSYGNAIEWRLTKYCTDKQYWGGNTPNPDGLTRLVLEDDIAAKTLGENWRIPSKKDFEELFNNTIQEWTSINSVDGCKFINKQDSSIYMFLPINYDGFHCWTSDINNSYPGEAYVFISDQIHFSHNYFFQPFTIRPVSPKLQTIHSIGVGESDGDHRNAVEVTTDGNIFIKGIGNYDGSNPQSAQSLQQLLINFSGGEAGLSPETAIVIAAALNDLNNRIINNQEQMAGIDEVVANTLVSHQDSIELNSNTNVDYEARIIELENKIRELENRQ